MKNEGQSKEEKIQTPNEDKKLYNNIVFEKGVQYNFNILEEEFSIKITKNFEVWEGKYQFQQILTLPMWKSLKNTKNLYNFITKAIEKMEFEVNLDSNPFNFIFRDYSKNMEDVFFEYILAIEHTKKGEPTRIEDLVSYIKDLENRLDGRLNFVEKKINSDSLFLENIKLQEEIANLKLGKKIQTEFLMPNGFQNYLEISDNQRTVKNLKDYWIGIRCNRIINTASNQRYYYSIRIEETDINSYIRIGFVSTTVNQTTGHGFGGVDNFCGFDISKNGVVYGGTTTVKIQNYISPKKFYIFDVVIDFSEKSIYLYFEGEKVGFGSVVFKYVDYSPCIDLYTTGDSVSLV
jgi:hypothetical protein